ncbi:MAG: BREX system P-loop protein BrxC [Saprospiraceae bacterium]
MAIKTLFGKDKDIYRGIEKVVTFGNASEEHLHNEISEYVVTERLRDNFEKILDALSSGLTHGTHEVGIWVSGFYGSGKSSFAKYLGFALDKSITVKGQSFTDRLANRINSSPISQLFKSIIATHNPAIVLLDCATEQIKGGTLPPILELLIAKVNQMAGYSTDSRLSYLEMMLERDGNKERFVKKVKDDYSKDWDDIKVNSILEANAIAGKIATEIYPNIWEDAKSFKTTRIDDSRTDRQKVTDLIETIKKVTGKENVLFIVDEVGQYIAAKDGLILSLQGTLENLKDIGQGKTWFLGTAQQTLTEDNPNARLNSDKLYKLNARFPISADIEASDIKEICTQRLLGKSSDAAKELKALYKQHGERLKHFSNLEHCEKTMYVKDSLDEKLFIDLYPFLPQHFEIIISLLGRLAKITGGVGLRSAIKVIQDVLTDNLPSEASPLAEQRVGTLATTYHIYDVLKADIQKSYSHVVSAVSKIVNLTGDSSDESKVAKSIGVLQLLDDFHLSAKNVAALMNPSVSDEGTHDKVFQIIEGLKSMPGCTLNEIDGQLRFMTEAITKIEVEKEKMQVSSSDIRKVYEGLLRDIFSPVPSARIENTKTIKTGINLNQDMRVFKILEPNEEIQTDIIFASNTSYDYKKEEISRASTEITNRSRLYQIGKLEQNIDNDLIEIVKCEGIYSTRNRYDDKESNDYLNSQDQRAKELKAKVLRILIQSLEKGEYIYKGVTKPTKSFGEKLREASNKKIKQVAEIVFDKYAYASISVPAGDAERLLKYPEIKNLPTSLNHYDLVKSDGRIHLSHRAIQAIREYIQREEHTEGRHLLDHFADAPFGWSKDTTRYLVAIMFMASEVKLRIAGEDIKVKGPSSIEALKNVNGFKGIGISLHDEDDKPTMAQLSLSVKRLAELTGVTVAPLQDKVAEVVRKYFPSFQTEYAGVRTELENLNLPGVEKAIGVQDGIKAILQGEGSEAARRLGKDDSSLFNDLLWIKKVHSSLSSGMKRTFKKAQTLKSDIESLPDSGLPLDLKKDCASFFESIEDILQDENFVDRLADLNDAISSIENECADYCQKLLVAENNSIDRRIHEIKSGADWSKLDSEQQEELDSRLSGLILSDKQGIDGIKDILNSNYGVNNNLSSVNEQIVEYIKSSGPGDAPKNKKVSLSKHSKIIQTEQELDAIINEMERIRPELKDNNTVQIDW